MAAPRQARAAGTAGHQPGPAAKTRNKGTRGGRPEPQPAGPARRPGNGQQQRSNGSRKARVAANTTAPDTTAPGAALAGTGPALAPLWLRLAALVLSLGGLGVSVWLTIAHYTSPAILACSDSGVVNCAKVTTSTESVLFGIVPVAVLGLAFFVAMTALTSPWAWRASWPTARWARLGSAIWPAVRWARLGSAIVGMAFVLYLVYTELITLDAICLWCTSVHVITFLLFSLIVFSSVAVAGPATGKQRP